jgi:chromosome segregation ATPase
VIEYILLFSLGFLTAALVALLVAPAIRRRIVFFTENRIKATMPISASELRAQSDMIRAAYAAENAKLSQATRHEREKIVVSEARAEKLWSDLKSEREQSALLAARAGPLESELVVLKEQLQKAEEQLGAARSEIEVKTAALAEGESRIADLALQVEHIGGLLDTGKIDVVARDTELESVRAMLNTIRMERDTLRDELRNAEERARHAEIKLEQDEGKIVRLQNRLDAEIAQNATREETAVSATPDDGDVDEAPVKTAEISELEKIRAKRDGGEEEKAAAEAETDTQREAIMIDQGRLAETIRADANAVSDILSGQAASTGDQQLRDEIASIAARMVALTAAKQGLTSPLLQILDNRREEGGRGRISLAERATRALAGKDA